MNGNQLKDNAREELNALRAKFNQQMEASGYSYFAGGDYDCQWACWVHSSFTHLVEEGYEPCKHEMAQKLGVDSLPEGAVVDVTYLW